VIRSSTGESDGDEVGTEGIEAVYYDHGVEEDGWNEVGRRNGGHGDRNIGLGVNVSFTVFK
jgi:hypothetical protein